MKSNPVKIPRTPLALWLDEAEALKRQMHDMLQELETQALGHKPTKLGAWRRRPADFLPPQQ